jgi:hypothetical protein
VFTRENGEPLHPASITDRFHELVTAVDLPPARLHDLRHGAASLMLAAGVDLKVVQETLGHSSLILTSDTYTSVYPAVAAAAADAAATIVSRAAGTEVVTPLSRQSADAHAETEPAGQEVGDTYHNTNRSVLVAAPEITLCSVGTRRVLVAGGAR